jgi:hypothetical protein
MRFGDARGDFEQKIRMTRSYACESMASAIFAFEFYKKTDPLSL